MMPSPERVYRINCDCSTYEWKRRPPPRGKFMHCRECGRALGDMQAELVRFKGAGTRKASPAGEEGQS